MIVLYVTPLLAIVTQVLSSCSKSNPTWPGYAGSWLRSAPFYPSGPSRPAGWGGSFDPRSFGPYSGGSGRHYGYPSGYYGSTHGFGYPFSGFGYPFSGFGYPHAGFGYSPATFGYGPSSLGVGDGHGGGLGGFGGDILDPVDPVSLPQLDPGHHSLGDPQSAAGKDTAHALGVLGDKSGGSLGGHGCTDGRLGGHGLAEPSYSHSLSDEVESTGLTSPLAEDPARVVNSIISGDPTSSSQRGNRGTGLGGAAGSGSAHGLRSRQRSPYGGQASPLYGRLASPLYGGQAFPPYSYAYPSRGSDPFSYDPSGVSETSGNLRYRPTSEQYSPPWTRNVNIARPIGSIVFPNKKTLSLRKFQLIVSHFVQKKWANIVLSDGTRIKVETFDEFESVVEKSASVDAEIQLSPYESVPASLYCYAIKCLKDPLTRFRTAEGAEHPLYEVPRKSELDPFRRLLFPDGFDWNSILPAAPGVADPGAVAGTLSSGALPSPPSSAAPSAAGLGDPRASPLGPLGAALKKGESAEACPQKKE